MAFGISTEIFTGYNGSRSPWTLSAALALRRDGQGRVVPKSHSTAVARFLWHSSSEYESHVSPADRRMDGASPVAHRCSNGLDPRIFHAVQNRFGRGALARRIRSEE